MRELPQEFCRNMEALLGKEYTAYIQSMEQPFHAAIRINTNKIPIARWRKISPFFGTRVPWTEKGQYYDPTELQPAKHPYYFAGLYYIQEPSAMIPASILPVKPGERILDLCAAPGGKATEIAARLQGDGLLVANDISVSRAMALTKNLQMAGTVNALVTAETPEHLAECFPEYFDGILIDAPCSGEGMFRRDPHMIKDWIKHGPAYYAEMQQNILRSAYQMLRPGGFLVYSTCTFSPLEDEQQAGWFITEFPDMQICPTPCQPGFAPGRPEWAGTYQSDSLRHAVRIFPHRTQGEGHFAVLLQKAGEQETLENRETSAIPQNRSLPRTRRKEKAGSTRIKGDGPQEDFDPWKEAEHWLKQLHLADDPAARLQRKRDQVILLPKELPDVHGLRVIQNGLIVGTVKKGRFEPSPQLALAVQNLQDVPAVSLPADDIRVMKYLKGETITLDETVQKTDIDPKIQEETDGYLLVCVDGFPLGWAKRMDHGKLKNKYYAGWRLQ